MNNMQLEDSLYLKNFTLNDLYYNLRMQRKGNPEFVSEVLLNFDLNNLNDWINELEIAHDNKERITLSSKNDGSFTTVIVNPDADSYERDYISQFGLLSAYKKICEQLLKGEIKSKAEEEIKVSEDEVDSIMDDIYTKTGIDNPNKKENKDDNTEKKVDEIMNGLYQKIDEEDKNASALEIILNEANDVISYLNSFIASHEDYLKYNIDNMIEWSKNSIFVLEKLKSDLEKEYKAGNKLPLSFLKPDGGYEIKFTENDEVYFNRQMEYYDGMIKSCQELENKLIMLKKTNDESKQDNKSCVVFKVGNDICIVGKDLSINDVQNLNSNIIHGASKKGLSVKLYNCPSDGLYSVCGIIVKMDENGIMTFDGEIDEIEFINHPENYKVDKKNDDGKEEKEDINSGKKQADDSGAQVLDGLLEIVNSNEYNLTKKSEDVAKYLEKQDPDVLWAEVLRRLDNNIMSQDEFKKLDSYLVSNLYGELRDNYFLKSSVRKQLVKKYNKPLDSDLDEKTGSLNSSNVLDQLITITKKGDKEKIAQLIKHCRADQIWKETMNRLDNKTMNDDTYQEFMNKFPSLLPSDYKDIIMGQASYHELVKKYPVKVKENTEDIINEKDEESKVMAPLPVSTKRRVKNRKDKKSLVQKFKDLKKWQKVALVAGAVVAGVAIVGLGVYHFVPGAATMINSFLPGGQSVDSSSVNHVATSTINSSHLGNSSDSSWLDNIKEFIYNALKNGGTTNSGATIDYSAIGPGHTIYSDAYSAVSGTNPLVANQYLSNNSLDVFNTASRQFLHLTPEQLHNAEFMRQLASDPNNAVLLGDSMGQGDGFMPLADIIGEVIKGGKVL